MRQVNVGLGVGVHCHCLVEAQCVALQSQHQFDFGAKFAHLLNHLVKVDMIIILVHDLLENVCVASYQTLQVVFVLGLLFQQIYFLPELEKIDFVAQLLHGVREAYFRKLIVGGNVKLGEEALSQLLVVYDLFLEDDEP